MPQKKNRIKSSAVQRAALYIHSRIHRGVGHARPVPHSPAGHADPVRPGHQIDIILFIKPDRWFRNVADYYEPQRILGAHHVQWIATDKNYDTTTSNGRLHLNIKLSIAQEESDRTSERIKSCSTTR